MKTQKTSPGKLALIMETKGEIAVLDLLIESCMKMDAEDTVTFAELHGMFEQMKKDAFEKVTPKIVLLN